jgi:hypothetical protein
LFVVSREEERVWESYLSLSERNERSDFIFFLVFGCMLLCEGNEVVGRFREKGWGAWKRGKNRWRV